MFSHFESRTRHAIGASSSRISWTRMVRSPGTHALNGGDRVGRSAATLVRTNARLSPPTAFTRGSYPGALKPVRTTSAAGLGE